MAGQTSYSSNIFTLSSTPVNVFKGKAWYNPDDGYLQIYQNDKWNIVNASDPTKQDKLSFYSEDLVDGVASINGANGILIGAKTGYPNIYIGRQGSQGFSTTYFNGNISGSTVHTTIPNLPSDTRLLSEKAIVTALSNKQDKLTKYTENAYAATIDDAYKFYGDKFQITAGNYIQLYDGDFYTNYNPKSIEVTEAYEGAGDTTFEIKNNTKINGNLNYTGILQKNGVDILATKQNNLKFYSETDTGAKIESLAGNLQVTNSGVSLFSMGGVRISGDGGVFLTHSSDINIKLDYTGININGAVSGTAISTSIPASEVAVNTKLPSEKAVADAIEKIFERIYPIGSIYISVNGTNPSSLFGGTWEQIKDRFLLATGDTYSPGVLSGEATHTLTIDEIPKHNHNLLMTPTGDSPSLTAAPYRGAANATEFSNLTAIQSVGGNQPHNNMPPYLTVYMWKRNK